VNRFTRKPEPVVSIRIRTRGRRILHAPQTWWAFYGIGRGRIGRWQRAMLALRETWRIVRA
jgi:hypothetical protein